MKTVTFIVRLLLGALLLFASIAFLFDLFPKPELTGNSKIFMEGMNASTYLFPLIKMTELFCGIAFISGYFISLAATVLAPISINIFLYHLFVDQSGMPVAIFIIFANLLLAWANKEKFRPMLTAK